MNRGIEKKMSLMCICTYISSVSSQLRVLARKGGFSCLKYTIKPGEQLFGLTFHWIMQKQKQCLSKIRIQGNQR